jgi:NAD(P)-dependent dehydrogenase (short-subunit alcohol dehydrogenase family)
MQSILLFGATGHLGKEIAREGVKEGFKVTAVIRSEARKSVLEGITDDFVVAGMTPPNHSETSWQARILSFQHLENQ